MTDPLGESAPPPQSTDGVSAPARPGESVDPVALPSQMRAARNEFELQVAHARAEFEEANARIKQRTGRDLILAILIGLGIGVVVVASLIFDKWPFVIFCIGVAVLGVFEFTRALQAAGRRVDIAPQLAGGALVMLSAVFLEPWVHWVAVFVAVALVIVWRLVGQMAARDGRVYAAVIEDVLIGGFVQLYVPFLASLALILLRQDGGEWWVLAFLIVAIAADTGAYVTGLTLGRHPMAPRISPKKTWEGFAGAAVASVIAGGLLAWLMLGLPWWTGIILGLVILGTATAGDLGESMVKRDLGIKDMSSWLPGHGGVLDRLDSILPSAVAGLALYYLLTPLAVS
ncbi:phosphatidate cytidylyltransferase [Microbacterium sp. cx-59]|uniref:phosphatidate cytidylyltransferase n=1 Tax=Microbacterium sp. cx-59 TaxID=2891207 RepID=UPI001E2CDBA2|nr:phosphatidate cytidylyltransferase [Microbacterium sp. cx-59]MCC4907137.1 phosphatidate cytidylyltransferase [Microbacterium sp. cx-59]